MMPAAKMLLPHLDLSYFPTSNESERRIRRPHLVVLHCWGNRPAPGPGKMATSRFLGNVRYMSDPESDVSAHIVYGGGFCPPEFRAVQLVAWDRKAWTQAGLNSASYSIEAADAIWALRYPNKPENLTVLDEIGFFQLARITAYICLRANIPPSKTRDPLSQPGIARHNELGKVGNPNGHTDPTTNSRLWTRFINTVREEYRRGGFRATWGRGRFHPLPEEV